jgi:hypothetical protein
MSIAEWISMILVVVGVILFLASFTNVEMITGLWVAGDIERDEEYIKAGQFRKRVYTIIRVAGILAFLSGCAVMQLIQS